MGRDDPQVTAERVDAIVTTNGLTMNGFLFDCKLPPERYQMGRDDLQMTAKRIDAIVTTDGLTINGLLFDCKLPPERYQDVLGLPTRTIDAGPPAPYGHRNNQVYVFDSKGIYMTEHHSSRLIESVNFIFDPADSPFPIERAFDGNLEFNGQSICSAMTEAEFEPAQMTRDFPGEYSVKLGNCWIGISALGRRDDRGKRGNPRYLVRVSVCF
jgi:hypothetical protein